ncbi:uncharacterized protein C8orf74 homolog isoform X2 [Lepisosteus oculatus]|uniref:uncharacterized protein C8orf74 homolog isoform X2 n=1 Tax=Lepisosteus oculatus TaxID=7918 RepID=UPI0035F51584
MACLTTAAIREIAKLERQDGIQHLRKQLRWKESSEDQELRQSVCLDFVYDNVMFAVKKGFPWQAVTQVGRIAEELLTESVALSQVISLIQNKLSQCGPRLLPYHHQAFFEFLMDTYVRHYYLYQSVLCAERTVESTVTELVVYVPPCPEPLSKGTDSQVWEYQQRQATLKEAEGKRRADIQSLKDSVGQQRENRLEKLLKDLQIQYSHTLDREVIERIVQDVVRAQVDLVLESLLKEVAMTAEILELKLQQKTLARPVCLPPLNFSLPSANTPTASSAKVSTVHPPKDKKKK